LAEPLTVLRGTLDVLVLKALTWAPMHGFEITAWIEARATGNLDIVDSALYQSLYRLEARGWIHGRWVEKAGQRRRRYYRLTSGGRQILDAQRHTWRAFADAIARVTGVEHA